MGDQPQPWMPRSYQRRGVELCVSRGAMGLLWDPGLGKTTVMLAAIKTLRHERLVRMPLVTAPLNPAYEVWPKEARKWTNFQGMEPLVLHGSRKGEMLADVVAGRERPAFCVINYDGLDWLARELGYINLKGDSWRRSSKAPAWPFDMLICDESTKIKRTDTRRFHLVRAIIGEFKRRYILTGTPIPNGMIDLFGQAFILDGGAALGPWVSHFRREFFEPSEVGGYDWEILPGAEEQIYRLVASIVDRVDAADELDLPPLVIDDILVDLPPAARELYDQVELKAFAELFTDCDGVSQINAVNAAVVTSKCGQIANGGVYDDQRQAHGVHQTKIDAVADLVEQLQGKPLLVAYDTRHDLARLQKRFPKAPYIGGGVSRKDAGRAIDDWNARRLPVLLVHPESAAHGLNLQESGSHLAWHSLTWNLEHYDQLIRRLLRQGQKAKRVVCHRIIAKATIDEVKVATLASKDRSQRAFLDALRSYARARNHKTRLGKAAPVR